jgi:mannan endo-1,4-beta-mannosidase
VFVIAAVLVVGVVFAARHIRGLPDPVFSSSPQAPAHPERGNTLSARPESYIGLYTNQDPSSYAGVRKFAHATGVKPDIVSYYSGWFEPFQLSFAEAAAKNGAVPLVQIDPTDISLSVIASGGYDAYLRTYARAVRAYQHPVILSFGHEMKGHWYSWGYKNASPAVFVAAWRHIVTVFREQDARNVTWLWTVNVIRKDPRVPGPAPWWPGKSYVNWVGIDGYYFYRTMMFDSIFGPTIAAVRALTHDPIIVAETAVTPTAGQPAKIADLFAGIRLYGLLGFVWFDSTHVVDWRLSSTAAIAALRRGAETYSIPSS